MKFYEGKWCNSDCSEVDWIQKHPVTCCVQQPQNFTWHHKNSWCTNRNNTMMTIPQIKIFHEIWIAFPTSTRGWCHDTIMLWNEGLTSHTEEPTWLGIWILPSSTCGWCHKTIILQYAGLTSGTEEPTWLGIFSYRKLVMKSSHLCMWDMSSFVMIALLSLHSDEILYFGAYKIFIMHLSCDLCCYSGVYDCRIRV